MNTFRLSVPGSARRALPRWSRPLQARYRQLRAKAQQWRHPFTYNVDVRDII